MNAFFRGFSLCNRSSLKLFMVEQPQPCKPGTDQFIHGDDPTGRLRSDLNDPAAATAAIRHQDYCADKFDCSQRSSLREVQSRRIGGNVGTAVVSALVTALPITEVPIPVTRDLHASESIISATDPLSQRNSETIKPPKKALELRSPNRDDNKIIVINSRWRIAWIPA
jgi:hypothetical protein